MPEPGNREDRLIGDAEPHLAFQRGLAVPKIVAVVRELAKLGERDHAAVHRIGRQAPPLRERKVANVRHRVGRLPAQDVPRHDIPGALAILLPDHIRSRSRPQFLWVKAIVSWPLVEQLGGGLEKRVRFTGVSRAVAHQITPKAYRMAVQALAIIPVMASLCEGICALGKKYVLETDQPSEPKALRHTPRLKECRIFSRLLR